MSDFSFTPSATAVREERERTGDGLVVCKRRLTLANMHDALIEVDDRNLDHAASTMLSVLKELVYMEQNP